MNKKLCKLLFVKESLKKVTLHYSKSHDTTPVMRVGKF